MKTIRQIYDYQTDEFIELNEQTLATAYWNYHISKTDDDVSIIWAEQYIKNNYDMPVLLRRQIIDYCYAELLDCHEYARIALSSFVRNNTTNLGEEFFTTEEQE